MPENAYLPTPTIGEPEHWDQRAACKGQNTNMFFSSQGSVDTMRAKNICATCPVRTQCLQAALEWPEAEDHGVLGGLDEWERKQLRRKSA